MMNPAAEEGREVNTCCKYGRTRPGARLFPRLPFDVNDKTTCDEAMRDWQNFVERHQAHHIAAITSSAR